MSDTYGELGNEEKQLELAWDALGLILSELDRRKAPWAKLQIITLVNLATIYSKKSNNEIAIELLEKVYQILEENNLLDTAYAPMTLMNLGVTYGRSNRFDDEKKCLFKALELNKLIYGANHGKVAKCLYNLGVAYKRQDDFQNALNYFCQANAIFNNSVCFADEIETAIKSQQDENFARLMLENNLSHVELLPPLKMKRSAVHLEKLAQGSPETQFFTELKQERAGTENQPVNSGNLDEKLKSQSFDDADDDQESDIEEATPQSKESDKFSLNKRAKKR